MNKPIFLAFLLFAPCLHGQETIVHTVDFPKKDASWTVEIKNLRGTAATADAPEEKKVTSVEVAQKGSWRRDTVRWTDGSTTAYWWAKSPEIVLFEPRQGADILSILPSQLGSRRFDASNFDWVGATTYRGDRKVKGESYREYLLEVPFEDGIRRYTVLVDPKTGAPFSWSDDTIIATFSFGPPPDEKLELPTKFREAFRKIAQIEAPAKPLGKR